MDPIQQTQFQPLTREDATQALNTCRQAINQIYTRMTELFYEIVPPLSPKESIKAMFTENGVYKDKVVEYMDQFEVASLQSYHLTYLHLCSEFGTLRIMSNEFINDLDQKLKECSAEDAHLALDEFNHLNNQQRFFLTFNYFFYFQSHELQIKQIQEITKETIYLKSLTRMNGVSFNGITTIDLSQSQQTIFPALMPTPSKDICDHLLDLCALTYVIPESLLSAQRMPNLTSIKVNDCGIKHLLFLPDGCTARELELRNNDISDSQLFLLHRSTNLESIDFRESGVSEEQYQELRDQQNFQAKHPNLNNIQF